MTLPESIAPIWSMPYSMKSMAGLGSRRRAEWLDFEPNWRTNGSVTKGGVSGGNEIRIHA
jgi:hypothetical protein